MKRFAIYLALLACDAPRVFYEPDVSQELAQAQCAVEAFTGDPDLAAAVVDVKVRASDDYLWHGRYETNGPGSIYLDSDYLRVIRHELYAHRLADLTEGDDNYEHRWCWEQMERVLRDVEAETCTDP